MIAASAKQVGALTTAFSVPVSNTAIKSTRQHERNVAEAIGIVARAVVTKGLVS